jgi:hypothetical protein
MMLLPLAICGICIVTSIIGTFFVKLGKPELDHGRPVQGPDRHRRAVDRRRGLAAGDPTHRLVTASVTTAAVWSSRA